MAYSNYQYPGYQPYYGQPVPDQLAQLRQSQFQQQPVIQPAPQPIAAPQIPPTNPQNNGIIWVNSKNEADSYLVAPGSAVALWDANNPVIYLRQADNTGKPTTKVFDLVERSDGPKINAVPLTNQITREEFDAVVDRLTALENKPCECSGKSGGRTKKKEEQDDG